MDVGYNLPGYDSEGNKYKSLQSMWKTEIDQQKLDKVDTVVGGYDQWYSKALEYWKVEID